MKAGTRISLAAILISMVLFIAFATYAQRRETADERRSAAETQWEYLIVSGGSANLSTEGNEHYPNMRKQPDGAFAREFFPLERNFDKLGARGWDLVSVHGAPNNPVYFFKRLKEGR